MSEQAIEVLDSHTGGEPTRLVLAGGPPLGGASVAEQLVACRARHDHFRTAVVGEPRGWASLVGALLVEPADPTAAAGVIFFNNVGYLGMCGHGTIGLVTSLAYLGRLTPGEHRFETPVGPVVGRLLEDGRVAVRNVPAYRHAAGVTVEVPGYGPLTGDVAWGGNWFFLADPPGLELELARVDQLGDLAWRVRRALASAGVTGAAGAEIDHIALGGLAADADSRQFVLCPGGAWDRSPCGTGTSARVACLAAEGRLEPGRVWRQESLTGSCFEATWEPVDGAIVPTIVGRAHVTARATLLLDEADPLAWGVR